MASKKEIVAVKKTRDQCPGCPLGTKALYCFNDGSPYELWYHQINRVKNALRIVRACDRWLKTHEKD